MYVYIYIYIYIFELNLEEYGSPGADASAVLGEGANGVSANCLITHYDNNDDYKHIIIIICCRIIIVICLCITRKGANGISANGVTANFMFFDRGTFRVPICQSLSEFVTFAATPLALTPFVRSQGRLGRRGGAAAAPQE